MSSDRYPYLCWSIKLMFLFINHDTYPFWWQPEKIIAVFPMRFKEYSDVIIATSFFQVSGWEKKKTVCLALLKKNATLIPIAANNVVFLTCYLNRNSWTLEVQKNGLKYLLAAGHPFLLQNLEGNLSKIWALMEDLSLSVHHIVKSIQQIHDSL